MLDFILNKLFGISEIKESKILQLVALCFFFTFIVTFSDWINSFASGSNPICSPHITYCDFYKSFLTFEGFPTSYDQSIFFIVLLAIIFLGCTALYMKDYIVVWMSLFILFCYKALTIYVFSAGNYDYYDIVLLSVFLFAKNKLYFLRIAYVLLYFLAATIKFHPGWILGTYFSSLQTGIPLFPQESVVLWGNIVIISQIILCWALLGKKNTFWFIVAEIFFMSFHFYSGILVEYRYLLTTIPMMIVLFILPTTIPYHRTRSVFVHVFFILLFLGQSVAILIPGDQKLTLEGNKYGLYMFESNHQCIARYEVYQGELLKKEIIRTSRLARDRCDPYDAMMRYQRDCGWLDQRISMTFDHSINGGPFYRIVDERDVCKLRYIPFVHNSWIKTEYDDPRIVGYPVKNFFDGRVTTTALEPTQSGATIILPGFENNDPIILNPPQVYLSRYVDTIILGYWIVWITILIIACILYIRSLYQRNEQYKNGGYIDITR